MAITEKLLTPARITFRALCRENTGSSILDSGSHFGRSHELPAIKKNSPIMLVSKKVKNPEDMSCGVSIETGAFMDAVFTIDRKVQRAFEKFSAQRPMTPWDELYSDFIAKIRPGWVFRHSWNTYNDETNLTQDFQCSVWSALDEDDWICAEEALACIRTHNGCDVRGGYSRPVWGRGSGEYSVPLDLNVDVTVMKGQTADGLPMTDERRDELSEQWSQCYFSNPLHYFVFATAEVVSTDPKNGSAVVMLKTGERIEVIFDVNLDQ